jgi:hypothetical protein
VAALWERQREKRLVSEKALSTSLQLTNALLGVALIVGALLSFRYHSGTVASSAALAVGILAFVYSLSAARFADVASGIARLGALTAVAFTFVYLCYGNYISLQRSSRRALQEARALLPTTTPLKVGFPFYFPFSATFYGPLMSGGEISVSPVADAQISNSDVDLFIVRGKDIDRLQAIAPDKQLLGKVGPWTIVKAR